MNMTRRMVGRISALVLAAGMAVVVQAPPAAFAADAVPGGLTAGDSLFPRQGNSGYDVSHYDINLAVNITPSATPNAVGTSSFSSAQTTITASTTGPPLSSYAFDLQGLVVSSVTVDGQPATFSRIDTTTVSNATTDNHKLIVTPATPVDGTFVTVVNYTGTPVVHNDTDGSAEGWNNTMDGATFLNQPVGAMTVFPNNNTPRDKATYTYSIDIPSKLATSNLTQAGGKPYPSAVASNGELVSKTPNGDGTRTTWVWNEAKPMASELALISIGRYDVYESDVTLNSGRTLHEWTFIDPAIPIASQTTTQTTRAQWKTILDFLESKYGPYPGNSIGFVTDVVPSAINYALETQDRSFFPNSASLGTGIHEIFHQWFGDSVSPTDWNDIWLNEGPATYSETQVPYEALGTSTTSSETSLFNSWNSTASGSSLWSPVTVASMTQASQLFGNPTYTRGSMTLAALKTVIGDANFETLMRQEQLVKGGTSRPTSEFIARAQTISGKDLTAFFNSWIYTTGKPAWPAKFNLSVAGPTAPVAPGAPISYVLTSRNTGKVTQNGSVVTMNLADVLDDATLGALPSGVIVDGSTLLWAVPSTTVGSSQTVTIPATVNAGTAGKTLATTAQPSNATLGGTCVGCSTSVVVGAAAITPSTTPTIAGTAAVGVELTATPGAWDPSATLAYQWYVDNAPVAGATSPAFTPASSAVGFPVQVTVTGTRSGFAPTTTTSAATANVVQGTLNGPTPTISGTPQIGVPLTVSPGAWDVGTRFTYQWRANGTTISGATGPSYTPAVASQVGQTVDVIVTGVKAGYPALPKTSAATAAVVAGAALVLTPTPTLTGTPRALSPYIASPGAWDDGVVLTFAWAANGVTIAGATAASYSPAVTVIGQTLTVTVTGTKPGIPAVSKTSVASDAVLSANQVLQPTPTITGTPRAGAPLTGVKGTWDASTTQTYKWYADGNLVAGENALTFTPAFAQIGSLITFEVTSTRSNYATVVKTSAPTTAVLAASQVLTPTPTVTGTPKVDVTLTGDPGTWDAGTALTYQWFADGIAVDGETGLTYTPAAAKAGKVITFKVTSTKTNYEIVTKTSADTAAVGDGDQVLTPTPTITGTAKVGVELTAVPGTWDAGATLSYQWLADGNPIGGVTTPTFTPGASKLGAVITVAVTSTKAGYTAVTKTSAGTDAVLIGDLTSTPVPTITGTAKVGTELTAVPGTWDAGVTLSYQWFADGTPIGATDSTYTPGTSKAGAVMSVAVTGTKAGYTAVTMTSAGTPPLAAGDLVSPVPTITGTAKVGVELTGVTGDWTDGTALTYQWSADGTPIGGATDATYTPGPGKAGAVIRFVVTGTKAGYTAVTRTSAGTDPVADGDQVLTPVPTVTGTPKVAVALTAVPGTWDAGVTLSYQWRADGTPVDGATGSTYTPAADKAGKVITVAVTGTKAGLTTVTRTSAGTVPVADGDLVLTPIPTITGTAKVGVLLTGVAGTWDDGVTLSYQWRADGVAIDGANLPMYVPAAGTVGKVLTLAVTGTKAGYASSAAKVSAATSPVMFGTQASTPTPTLTGSPQALVSFAGVPGLWDDGAVLTFQWSANGAPIDGATSTAYTPTAGQVGSVLTLAVTGTRTGYVTVTKTSAGSSPVAAATQVLTPTPTLTGTPQALVSFVGVPGTWDTGTVLTYQWSANGTAIGGATSAAYTPTTGQVGSVLTLAVTGTRTGYTTVTRTSAGSSPVAAASQVLTPTPTVTGTAKVGVALSGVPGTWDTGTSQAYQWLADGVAVASATGLTYTPTGDKVGKVITFKVTSTRTGYATATRTSLPTAAVVVGIQVLTPTPTITGTAKVGTKLTAVPGTWDTGVTFTYQWLANGAPISGVTASTYTPGASKLGTAISVVVTGHKVGYTNAVKTSAATARVAQGLQVLKPTPKITGSAKVGKTLRAVPGRYDAGVVLHYQWWASGKIIDGATHATFKPKASLLGRKIRVKVTATKPGYVTLVRTSAVTAKVTR